MIFKPVRLASIGIGYWGRMLAQAALACPQANLVGCYAPTQERRVAFAQEFNARAYASITELLADPLVEAVLITAPNAEHARLIAQAAEAGKHILVEKPIALSIPDALASLQACQKAGVILAVGHQYRRESPIRKMKTLLDSGEIGSLISVEANISTGTGLQQAQGSWRLDENQVPGGPLIQIGIHHADTLIYLLGGVESVSSVIRRSQIQEIDDTTISWLQFQSGVAGTLVSNYCTAYSSEIKVMGTKGTLVYDRHTGLELRRDTPGRQDRRAIAMPPNDPVREQVCEFTACVRTGERPEVGGEDGLWALAVILAAVKSHQEKRPVMLQELF
jgi:predicted dehydrogenase